MAWRRKTSPPAVSRTPRPKRSTSGAPHVASSSRRVRLTAGCDKRLETCRFKFNNLLNFRGFPDVPEDDWLIVNPARAGAKSGGSRR